MDATDHERTTDDCHFATFAEAAEAGREDAYMYAARLLRATRKPA